MTYKPVELSNSKFFCSLFVIKFSTCKIEVINNHLLITVSVYLWY